VPLPLTPRWPALADPFLGIFVAKHRKDERGPIGRTAKSRSTIRSIPPFSLLLWYRQETLLLFSSQTHAPPFLSPCDLVMMSAAPQSDDAPPMPRVAAAAAVMGDIIARRIAAIPKEQTPEGRRAKAAVEDAALLERCAANMPRPASDWAPTVDAFVAHLRCHRADRRPEIEPTPDDTVTDDEDENEDDNQDGDANPLIGNDRGKRPEQANSAASTATNFLGPLDRMGTDIYAITPHPENAHLIGCCTRTPPLIEADCGYGDWRFIVAMERDVDCVGGMLLIRRAVHALTGVGVDARCDLRCQNTRPNARALLFSFFQSGETSISAFLQGKFASFDRIIDVLHAHGWDTRGKRLSWSDVDRALYDQHISCTRADGTRVHLFWRDGILVASNCKYGPYLNMPYPPASTYGPDPGSDMWASNDDDDEDNGDDDVHDDDDDTILYDDHTWLIERGYVAPHVLAARSGSRPDNCPAVLIQVFGDGDTTDADIVTRMDAVADQIARCHGLKRDASVAWTYGSDRLNGWTCDAALGNVLNLGARTWRLAMRDRSIVSGERYIDPQKGLYTNWMVTCDMLPMGNRHEGTVRTTGVPFVRFQGHMLGIDASETSPAVQTAHVIVVLCEPMSAPLYGQEPTTVAAADGEASRITAMVEALRDHQHRATAFHADATPVALHPISAYYRQCCVESRRGPKVMTVLHEASSVPRYGSGGDPSGEFVAALEWLMGEFEHCARLFAADAASTVDLDDDHGWTLEFD